MKFFPESTLVQLEYEKVKVLLSNHCKTEFGKAKCAALRIHTKKEFIETELRQTNEYKLITQGGQFFPNDFIANIAKELKLLSIQGAVLSGEQFLLIKCLTQNTNNIFRWFDAERRQAYGALAKVINGIIVSYQHDRKFKYDFSQSLTILYPAIQLLFSRGIGEEERTILGTTVQVYTADSIVNYMSSDGVSSRLLPEFNKSMHVSSVYVTRMMTSTVKFLLKDIGCHRSRVSDEFLKDR